MNYRKQPDGKSWLVFAKEDNAERRLAIARIKEEAAPFTAEVERLDAKDSELAEIDALAAKILRRFTEASLQVCVACANPLIQSYILALAKACGVRERILPRLYEGRSSEEMFELMAKEMYWQEVTEEKTFSEVWLVAERETWPLAVFDKTLRSKFPSVHFAFTHPSFEYWLLLHDPDFDGTLPYDREEVVSAEQREERIGRGRFRKTVVCEIVRGTSAAACRRVFAQRLPGYAKNPSPPPAGFLRGLRTALERSEDADPETADCLSQMPALFERFCRLGRRKPEDVLAELEGEGEDKPTSSSEAQAAEADPARPVEPEAAEAVPVAVSADAAPQERAAAIEVPARIPEVLAELFELTGKWQKAPETLAGDDFVRGRLLLERMREWGELDYREFKRGLPMFSAPMLADSTLLSSGAEAEARECAFRHILKLRCPLGELYKGKFHRTQKSMLALLAEIRLCLAWFERSAPKVGMTDGENEDAAVADTEDAPPSPLAETERSAPEAASETPEPNPRCEAPASEPEAVNETAFRQVLRELKETLTPFTTRKAYRLDRTRTDRSASVIETVFSSAYDLLLAKTGKPYVRTAAAQAEIDRFGRFETDITRADFVKACRSLIGALGNAESFGAETDEGTLLTLLDRLEVAAEWLTLDCTEP